MSRHSRPLAAASLALGSLVSGCAGDASSSTAAVQDARAALLERAAALELATRYSPPPGDPLHHHASGFAKILCSAVFITGLDPDFAAEHIGFFTSPFEERCRVSSRRLDRERQAVHVTLAEGLTRTAVYLGDQGCVTLPLGEKSVQFTPVEVETVLPDAASTSWPMGDQLPDAELPEELDAAKLREAVDAAFAPEDALTAAFVVTWKGRLVAERYRDGIDAHTPLESWSMGKGCNRSPAPRV